MFFVIIILIYEHLDEPDQNIQIEIMKSINVYFDAHSAQAKDAVKPLLNQA